MFLSEYQGGFDFDREEIEELRWINFDELKSEMLEEPRKFSSWFMIAAPKVLKLISER